MCWTSRDKWLTTFHYRFDGWPWPVIPMNFDCSSFADAESGLTVWVCLFGQKVPLVIRFWLDPIECDFIGFCTTSQRPLWPTPSSIGFSTRLKTWAFRRLAIPAWGCFPPWTAKCVISLLPFIFSTCLSSLF